MKVLAHALPMRPLPTALRQANACGFEETKRNGSCCVLCLKALGSGESGGVFRRARGAGGKTCRSGTGLAVSN